MHRQRNDGGRWRISILGAVLGLVVAIQAGCSRGESVVDRGTREQVLHRGLSADLADLDPQLVTGLPEINVVTSLFEGLVADDPRDLHPVPGVAESWDVSPDGLVYIFHLRANARWSDGTPVTAADFVASFRRILTPALAADYAAMLEVLVNARAYHEGTLQDFSAVGVAATDARTLRLTLAHPAPYFLSELSHPAWFPVNLPAIARAGPADQRGNRWTRPGSLVGNGPFVLKEWRPGDVIVVEKSPTYWDAAHVRLQAIHFHPAADVDSEERAFRAGLLHLTESLPFAKVAAYRREHPELLQITPFLDTYFYRLNTTRPGLTDPRVRRALALAIDRPTLVEKILQGGQAPAHSFVPPGCGAYAPPDGCSLDLATARRLLAEAGYPDGRGFPHLMITINVSGNHRVIAEAIQEMWRRNLGVEIAINNMEQASLLSHRRSLDYDILRSDWSADYLDPKTFLDVFSGASSNNHTGWKNPDYDRALDAAEHTPDAAVRAGRLREAETILLADMPIIPIYYFTTVRLVRPSVHGWYPTPLDRHPYKYVWLEKN